MYEMDAANGRQTGAPVEPQTIDLLDVPAAAAAHGFYSFDLSVYHLPSIERAYLADLRAAFESENVELFQLLIDTGDVDSADPDERAEGIRHIKRWMDVAVELGATGVRYVPGDGEPMPETIRASGEAFRELADYAGRMRAEASHRKLPELQHESRAICSVFSNTPNATTASIADFGNARGPDKYETLEAIMPRATSIHAWAEVDENGDLISEDFQRCLTIARDNGFDGPIMLQSGYPVEVFQRTREVWARVDEMRDEVRADFGEALREGI